VLKIKKYILSYTFEKKKQLCIAIMIGHLLEWYKNRNNFKIWFLLVQVPTSSVQKLNSLLTTIKRKKMNASILRLVYIYISILPIYNMYITYVESCNRGVWIVLFSTVLVWKHLGFLRKRRRDLKRL